MMIRYRGFRARPFIRWSPIRIGRQRLYCIGPLAIFTRPTNHNEQEQPNG